MKITSEASDSLQLLLTYSVRNTRVGFFEAFSDKKLLFQQTSIEKNSLSISLKILNVSSVFSTYHLRKRQEKVKQSNVIKLKQILFKESFGVFSIDIIFIRLAIVLLDCIDYCVGS